MEPIKRKRVTRVGSGAFSIYLPKKWIDSWATDEDREVDLHRMNQALLLVPAHLERTLERAITPDTATASRFLLSAYLRGLDGATFRPLEGTFGNEAVAGARDLLRHLDERIVATCTPDVLGFRLDPSLQPPATDGGDILRAMAAKLREMLHLAAEAVDQHSSDPERSLHAMRLLVVTQREDVQRLLYQAVRLVARIELPMDSVSDFQFLDLVASDLERMGGHLVRIMDTLLAENDLHLRDLDYPLEHLLGRIGPANPLDGLAHEMVVGFRRGFDETVRLFDRTLTALSDRRMDELGALQREILEAQDRIGDRVFASITQHWGQHTEEGPARSAFAMSKVGTLLSDALHAMHSVARHASSILTAAETPEGTS